METHHKSIGCSAEIVKTHAAKRLNVIVFTLHIFLIAGLPALVRAGPLEDGITALDAGRYRVAYEAFLKGAKAGNAEAQVQLATLLIDGSAGFRDRKEAALWLQRAADQGHPDAPYTIGVLFYEGVDGKSDVARAAQWFERAATRGHPQAAYNLAVLLDEGKGITRDRARALTLYRQAADGGVLEAEHTLGSMLAFGRNVPRDLIEGVMWLELALQGGDGHVKGELDTLRRSLSKSQRAEIKGRVEAHLRKAPHH